MKNKMLFVSKRGDVFFIPEKYIKDMMKALSKISEKKWTDNNFPTITIEIEEEWYLKNLDKYNNAGSLRLWGDGNGYLLANEYSNEDDIAGYPVRDGDLMLREIDLISLRGSETKPCWVSFDDWSDNG